MRGRLLRLVSDTHLQPKTLLQPTPAHRAAPSDSIHDVDAARQIVRVDLHRIVGVGPRWWQVARTWTAQIDALPVVDALHAHALEQPVRGRIGAMFERCLGGCYDRRAGGGCKVEVTHSIFLVLGFGVNVSVCFSSLLCLPSWSLSEDDFNHGLTFFPYGPRLNIGKSGNCKERAHMDIGEAILHALRGNSVLFVGAGFTFGARNSLPPPDNYVPNASEFSRHLASSLGISKDYDLPIISQYYISQKGEHGLITELINSFSITSVVDHHLEVAKVPWRRVYTTNYDNCFEFSALRAGSEWTALTLDVVPTAASKRCIHINGHISNLTIDSLETQIRLTHSSYSVDTFASSFWSRQFRQDLNQAKSVFFVGYSLADIDIARIFVFVA